MTPTQPTGQQTGHQPLPPGPSAAAQAARPAVRVAVDNNHCHHYGICVQEAPAVFALRSPTRLTYTTAPDAAETPAVQQAARLCPMHAITVDPA